MKPTDPVSPPSASAEAASAPKIQPNWRAFRQWVEKRQEKNIGARFAEADAILAEMVRREMWADDNDPPMEPAPAEPASVPAGEARQCEYTSFEGDPGTAPDWRCCLRVGHAGPHLPPDYKSRSIREPVDAPRATPSEPRRRDIELLRQTLSNVCDAIWRGKPRSGVHMWTIPVDQERDFDCILSDAIDELEALRAEPAAPAAPPADDLPTPSEPHTLAPAAEYIRHLRDCPARADEHCTCGAVAFLRVVESTSQQLSDAVATIARIAAESADDLRPEVNRLRQFEFDVFGVLFDYLRIDDATALDLAREAVKRLRAADDLRPQVQALRESPLTFHAFSVANRARCESKNGFHHALSAWTASDWMTALVGEVGETANVIKKLNRYRDGVPGNKESEDALRDNLRKELGDVFVYLDLLCQSLGFTVDAAAVEVFEAKSAQIGYPAILAPKENTRA